MAANSVRGIIEPDEAQTRAPHDAVAGSPRWTSKVSFVAKQHFLAADYLPKLRKCALAVPDPGHLSIRVHQPAIEACCLLQFGRRFR